VDAVIDCFVCIGLPDAGDFVASGRQYVSAAVTIDCEREDRLKCRPLEFPFFQWLVRNFLLMMEAVREESDEYIISQRGKCYWRIGWLGSTIDVLNVLSTILLWFSVSVHC